MEKLQPFIAGVKKYNFWIVLSLVFLLLLYFWAMTASTFGGPFKKNVRTIKSHFQNMNKLGSRDDYPNDAWEKVRNEERGLIDDRLNQVARENYSLQRDTRNWGDFGDEVRADAKLPEEDLSEYWLEVLPNEVKGLKKLVSASLDENATGKLVWNRKNFNDIVGQVSPESVRKHRATQIKLKGKNLDEDDEKEWEDLIKNTVWPSTGKVIAAQEVVWVYQALLNAVNKVNDREGVDKFNLPIRAIEKINVWAEADAKKDAPTQLGSRRVRRAGATATASSGKKGIPVPRVKDFYRVIPVRMELQMDHQFLAPLLVALANQSLTCEVVDLELTSNPGFKKKETEEEKAARLKPARPTAGHRSRLGRLGRPGPAAKQEPKPAKVSKPRGKRTVVEALFYLAKPPTKRET